MYVQQQQQPGYYQPQPQVVQMQPMMQPMQPMMQQPMQPMMQPMQPMQPMYGQPTIMVQPQVMMQPVMQPVIQVVEPLPMAGGVLLGAPNPGMMGGSQTPGVPSYQSINNVLNGLKESTNFIVRYMEPNFRPSEGGYKFGIFGRDKNTPFAYGYATANGDASIEATDFNDAYGIVQVKNTSAQIHNVQTGQRDMFGTVALNRGNCGSFQVAAEKNGNRTVIFQNRQFSLLLCCCCSLLYLVNYQCCTDKSKYTITNGDGNEIGQGVFKTDQLGSYREIDITLNSGDQQQNAFVILETLLYMYYKIRNSLKGQNADISFEF